MTLKDLGQLSVIEGAKIPQKKNNIPAVVRIITAQEIKDRGYITLEEALGDLPGIQFRNIQGFNTYSFIRGIPNQNNLTLLLIDGIPVNELNSGGFYGGSQHNLNNVKRIEVNYGPASALYGTNAISGVVNLITYAPEDPEAQGTQVGITGGGFNTYMLELRRASYDSDQKWGYSFATAIKTTAKADLGGLEGDNNWSEDFENFEDDVSLEGKLTYQQFDFGLLYQNKKASRTTTTKTIGTNRQENGPFWEINFLNLWAKHQYKLNDQSELMTKLYYRDTTVPPDVIPTIVLPIESSGLRERRYRPGQMQGLESQLHHNFSNHMNLTAGLVLEAERLSESFSITTSEYDTIPDKPPPPPQINTNLSSLYIQAQYISSGGLETTLGIRHDNSNYYGTVTTPRFGLVYNYGDLSAKLLYTEAFRAPKPWDYTYREGNPNLQPVEIQSAEVYLGYFLNDNTQAELSLYDNRISDFLVINSSADRFINHGENNVYGAEFTLSHKREHSKTYINYTYNDSVNEAGSKIPEISQNSVNFGISYNHNEHMKLDLRAKYLGKRKNSTLITTTGNDVINSAFVYNLSMSYQAYNGWDIQLMVKNLFDKEYYHTSNLSPERFRQSQRTVLLKLQYTF